jgi:RimJ/RimL family protein N-acetyltransferase
VRRLLPADAPAYRALRLRALLEHADAFTSSHDEDSAKPLAATQQRLAADSGDTVWGAFAGEALIGMIGLGREPRMKIRHKGVVFGMYVAHEHCGRGVGAALLAHLIDEARSDPLLHQLTLTVTATNDGARTLYERAGFAAFGVEPRAVRIGGVYHDKIHMIRFLGEP